MIGVMETLGIGRQSLSLQNSVRNREVHTSCVAEQLWDPKEELSTRWLEGWVGEA